MSSGLRELTLNIHWQSCVIQVLTAIFEIMEFHKFGNQNMLWRYIHPKHLSTATHVCPVVCEKHLVSNFSVVYVTMFYPSWATIIYIL